MLDTLDNEGHFTWTCVSCQRNNAAHHSDEEVTTLPKAHIENLVARGLSEEDARAALASVQAGKHIHLPPCECGTQTILKADFTADELQAPNMVDKQGLPTASHEAALRHMQLLQQMKDVGKA